MVKTKLLVLGLTTVLGLLVAGTAWAFSAVHNPPFEYRCDNDPGLQECGWVDKYRNLTLASDPAGVSGDYRWAASTYNETAAGRWIVHHGGSSLGARYDVRAYIPASDGFSNRNTPYYLNGDQLRGPAGYGFDQVANHGQWMYLGSQWMWRGMDYPVAAGNEGASGTNTGWDAIDALMINN